MKRGTDPDTGKSYGILSNDDRKAIARVKTLAESWWWANREWKDERDPKDPPTVGENVSRALAEWLEFDDGEPPCLFIANPPKPESDTPTPESTLKPGNPLDKK